MRSLTSALLLGAICYALLSSQASAKGANSPVRDRHSDFDLASGPYYALPERDTASSHRAVGRQLRPGFRGGIRKKSKSGDFTGLTLPPLSPASWTYSKSNVHFDEASPSSPTVHASSPDRPFLGNYYLAPGSPSSYERTRGNVGFASPGLADRAALHPFTIVDTSAGVAGQHQAPPVRLHRSSPHRQRVRASRPSSVSPIDKECLQPGDGCDWTSPLLHKDSLASKHKP